MRSGVDWLFLDRRTGRIVIAQRPNLTLTLWLVCLVVARLTHPHGAWSTALRIVGAVALVAWAGDEIARGVNPWRRLLGAAVLVGAVVGWALAA